MRRRRALQVAGGVLTGTFAGCTSTAGVFETYRYERDAPIDGPEAAPWPTLAHDARRSSYVPHLRLPSSTAARLFAYTWLTSEIQPALVDGTAYFGAKQFDQDGIDIFVGPPGLQAAGGDIEDWFLPEADPLASPTVVSDALFVTSDGVTRALDRRDGTLCWEYHGGSSYPTAAPAVADGTIYVCDERVFALNATNGAVRWATDPLEFGLCGAAATGEGAFVTTGGDGRGKAYRFDPGTGQREWVTSLSSRIAVPPVLGDLVYVVETDGWLRALDPSSGREVWSRELGGRSSAMPAVAEGTAYAVATEGNTLYAFDASTGAVRWRFDFEGRRAIGPTVAGNSIYLPTGVDDGGIVHWLAADSGSVLGTHDLPEEPVSPLVIGVGTGLVCTGSPISNTRLYLLGLPEPDDRS